MTHYQPGDKKSGGARRRLIAASLFTTATVALVVFFRMSLLERLIVATLDRQGLAPVSLDVERFGLSGLTLTNVEVADTFSINNVEVSYTLASLRQSRVQNVNVERSWLKGDWTNSGFTFGALDHAIARLFKRDADASETALPFDQLRVADSTVSIAHPQGAITLDIGVVLDGTDSDLNVGLEAQISGPDLRAQMALDGSVIAGDWLGSTGTAALSMQAQDFLTPGLSDPFSANLDIRAKAGNGEFSVSASEEIKVSGPWPLKVESFHSQDHTFDLSVLTQEAGSPLLRLGATDDGYQTSINLDALWVTPLGRATTTVAGTASLSTEGLLRDFNFDSLNLQIDGAPTPAGTLWAKVAGDGLRGGTATGDGKISFSGRLLDGTLGKASFEQIDLSAATLLGFDGPTVSLALEEVVGTITNGTYDNQVRFEEPLTIALAESPGSTQSIAITLDPDGPPSGSINAAIQLQVPKALLIGLDSALSISALAPQITAKADWSASILRPNLQLELIGGEIRSDLGAITNISTAISGTPEQYSGPLSANIRLAQARPGTVSAVVKSDVSYKNNSYIFKGVTETFSQKKLGSYTLSYRPDIQSGLLEAVVGPLKFGGSELSPTDLRPLALPFTPTSGEFAATINLPIGLQVQGNQGSSILLKDIELEAPSYAVRLMNAAINLATVSPVQTDGPQTVAIGLLQAGVPVTNVLARFYVQTPRTLDIDEVSMSFAEGKLRGGPFSVSLDGQPSIANLEVSGVSLPVLAELSTLDGLEASGDLTGQIPLRLSTEGVIIDQGTLKTTRPGFIRYRPGQAAGAIASSQSGQGGMGLALDALENFQYDSVTVSVSGSILDELEASLAIKGRNPALYNGYPIDFNLNLSGELVNVIQGSLAGYRVPETIKRQLLNSPLQP